MFSNQIKQKVEILQESLTSSQKKLACAESCTGGLVSAAITEMPGSSSWFQQAYVTYSNKAKMDMLSVDENTLSQYGAVSTEVVEEMAIGCLNHSQVDFCLAISGIAGPSGGSREKPVGTVCFAWAWQDGLQTSVTSTQKFFSGDRSQVRLSSVNFALEQLIDIIQKK